MVRLGRFHCITIPVDCRWSFGRVSYCTKYVAVSLFHTYNDRHPQREQVSSSQVCLYYLEFDTLSWIKQHSFEGTISWNSQYQYQVSCRLLPQAINGLCDVHHVTSDLPDDQQERICPLVAPCGTEYNAVNQVFVFALRTKYITSKGGKTFITHRNNTGLFVAYHSARFIRCLGSNRLHTVYLSSCCCDEQGLSQEISTEAKSPHEL
jgi:hypothetical protein